jgi:hypothetical protein
MTLYPNTRPAESWAQCAVGFRNMGTSIRVDRVRLRWPDPPHPGLHSPEVMTEDPTTEPCAFGHHHCKWGTVTRPGRTFVAWHTLGPVPPAPETERRWFTVEVSGLPESVDDGEVRGELASAVSRLHRKAGGAGLSVGTRSTRTEPLDGTDGD